MKTTKEGSLPLYFVLSFVILALFWQAYLLRPLNCRLSLGGICAPSGSNRQVLATSGANRAPFELESTGVLAPKLSQEISTKLKPMKLNYGYIRGQGTAPDVNSATGQLLSQLGYSNDLLWRAGIKIVPNDGPVPLRCSSRSGATSTQGIAVKPNQQYLLCDDGKEMIDGSYRTSGKCTVVFNWQNYRLDRTATGNSQAILAHEIGHCLDFVYGESKGLTSEFRALRPGLKSATLGQTEEIVADDFMICRHQSDTSWGSNSYYQLYGFEPPSAKDCQQANRIFSSYYPL